MVRSSGRGMRASCHGGEHGIGCDRQRLGLGEDLDGRQKSGQRIEPARAVVGGLEQRAEGGGGSRYLYEQMKEEEGATGERVLGFQHLGPRREGGLVAREASKRRVALSAMAFESLLSAVSTHSSKTYPSIALCC